MAGHHRRKFHYFRNRRNPGPDATSLALLGGAAVGLYFLFKHIKPGASGPAVPVNGYLGDVAMRGKDGQMRAAPKVVRNRTVKRVKARKIRRAGKRDRRTKQVISAPVNGLEGFDQLAGFGSVVKSIKKAVSSAGSAASKVVKQVTVPAAGVVQKIAPVVGKVASTVVTAPLKVTREVVRPIDPLNDTVGKVLDKPLNAADSAAQIVTGVVANVVTGGTGAPQVQTEAPVVEDVVVYQDANGNPISKEEYDRLMALANEPIYQDADGNTITKEEYDRLMAEYNASLLTPPVPTTTSPATPVTTVPTPVVTSTSATDPSAASSVVYTSSGAASDAYYPSAPAVSTPADVPVSASAADVQAATPQGGGINPVVAVGAAGGAALLLSMLGN